MTGSQTERDLVNALEACGWRCMRAPASGGGTARDMPDVLAGQPDPRADLTDPDTPVWADVMAIELKTTSKTTAYVDAAEVTALERFAVDFGADACLAAKFKGSGTRTRIWLVRPTNARIVDGSGRHGLPVADIEDRATMVVLPSTDAKDAEVRRL